MNPMSSSSNTCSTSWEQLAPDLLRLIFRLLTFRARLYCVSLVCKRWRTVVLRSVKAAVLPKVAQEEVLMYRSLPSLTDLRVRRDRLPSSNSMIKALRITVASTTLVKLDQHNRIYPSLTYFSYTGPAAPLCLLLIQLSSRAATGLTALHISLPFSNISTAPMQLDKKLTSIRFPNLTSFSFSALSYYETTLISLCSHLLTAHSTQLTRLNMCSIPNVAHDSFMFPRVTKLQHEQDSFRYPGLLKRFPSLVEMNASLWHLTGLKRDNPEVFAKLAPLIVTAHEHDGVNLTPIVADLPKLREVVFKADYPCSEDKLTRLSELAPLVVKLAAKFTLPELFTNLTDLRFMPAEADLGSGALPFFPRLKFVTFQPFQRMHGAQKQLPAARNMTKVVNACFPPRVQCVTFTLDVAESAEVSEELRTCLRAMRAKEVAKVVWQLKRINAEGEALLREFNSPWMHAMYEVDYDPTRCSDAMLPA